MSHPLPILMTPTPMCVIYAAASGRGMIEQVFCDTGLIIDHINGRNDLLLRLAGQKVILHINSIVEMELLQGAHDKRELRKIEQSLNLFRCLELQQAVFDQATQWVRE